MLALSPRAVERLETYQPSWPIPKVFRLANNKKLIKGIFEGNTINTPSMICVEDSIDSLNWVKRIGGLNALIKRSNKSFNFVSEWISKTTWVDFMCADPSARSNTGITFQINEDWFIKMDDISQREVMKKIISKLEEEKVANDINGYPKAPPSFRVWGGSTVEPEDINTLLPWIEWAYSKVKSEYA